jgi:hypothetical protein
MSSTTPPPSLQGWGITRGDDAEGIPWGQDGKARAKVLGQADGYVVVVVEAEAGYQGTPHRPYQAEFFYLVDGQVRNQGQELPTAVTAMPPPAGRRTNSRRSRPPPTSASSASELRSCEQSSTSGPKRRRRSLLVRSLGLEPTAPQRTGER